MKWLLLSSFANEECDEDQKRRKERRENPKSPKRKRSKNLSHVLLVCTYTYVFLLIYTYYNISNRSQKSMSQ